VSQITDKKHALVTTNNKFSGSITRSESHEWLKN
jgi:hypothetical protein